MKGTTHLMIGIAAGSCIAAAWKLPFNEGAQLVVVASISALAPDLDGQSILSRKISKLSEWIRSATIALGMLMVIVTFYLALYNAYSHPLLTSLSGSILLLGLFMRQGTLRNLLISLIGIGMLIWGLRVHYDWLMGLSGFLIIAPWFKHRGMTHTLWITLFWCWIGWRYAAYSGIPGIAWAAGCGYFSHLLADTLTPAGIRWLYPLSHKAWKLPIFKS